MTERIMLESISVDDFFKKIENSLYAAELKASKERHYESLDIDWNALPYLLGTESIAKIFDVEMDTIRKWIKSRTFGDYQQDGRLLFVAKSAVKRYHDSIIKTNKR